MKKRIISFVLGIATALSLMPSAIAYETDAEEDLFKDLPMSHWAYDDIYKLKEKGAISGVTYDTFNPDGNITREQFLKIIINAFGIKKQNINIEFKDVKKNSWYEEFVKTGIAGGIVKGQSAEEFGVGKNISRQDVCLILARVMGLDIDEASYMSFADQDSIAGYAKNAVSKLVKSSIISGFSDNTFKGSAPCTRAQASRIIMNALKEEEKFYDGARTIVFMGDSLTNAAEYAIYINAFLKTRFPNEKIKVVYAGTDGERAVDMLKRYESDVLDQGATEAYILFGANDINRGLYPTGDESGREAAISNSTENIEKIVTMLKADGIKNITVLTPPVIDERQYKGASAKSYEGVSKGLRRLADNYIAVAKKHGVKYVDLTDITGEILEAKKDTGEVEIYKTDRIHPNRMGHFVMASQIIKTQYKNNGVVASVDVKLDLNDVFSNNATVSDLKVDENGVISYTYTAKALPMGLDEANITEAVAGNGYGDAEARYGEFINFTDTMNREIIKVSGLEGEGNFDIAFDGEVIGTFTAKELTEGVNIATLEKNPGQIKAKAVIDMYMKDYWDLVKVRRCYSRFAVLKKNGMYGASRDMITSWVNENYPEGHAQRSYWTSFLDLYDDYDMYKAKWDKIDRDAHKIATPGTHKVTITPVEKGM